MMIFSKGAIAAAVAFGGLAVQSVAVSAMPIDAGVAVAAHSAAADNLQQAYWHGGWHHRWHRHRGWHPYGGWHRHWGWRHRHWHRY